MTTKAERMRRDEAKVPEVVLTQGSILGFLWESVARKLPLGSCKGGSGDSAPKWKSLY